MRPVSSIFSGVYTSPLLKFSQVIIARILKGKSLFWCVPMRTEDSSVHAAFYRLPAGWWDFEIGFDWLCLGLFSPSVLSDLFHIFPCYN